VPSIFIIIGIVPIIIVFKWNDYKGGLMMLTWLAVFVLLIILLIDTLSTKFPLRPTGAQKKIKKTCFTL